MFEKLRNIELKNILKGDRIMWNSILVLAGFSIVAVYSSSGALAYQEQGGNTTMMLFKQIGYISLGVTTVLVFQFIPYKLYFKHAPAIYIISIGLLIITLTPLGKSINGATRWIEIPFTGITFQPSEIAKIALIVFVARVLSVGQENEEKLTQAVKFTIGLTLFMAAFTIKSGLSTTLLLIVTVAVLLFLGRVKIKQILMLVGTAILGISLVVIFILNSGPDSRFYTWKSRIEHFGDDEENKQANEAKIAIVTGGVFGKGPGNSVQRNVLPQSYSDFIYASIIEEYGWIGAIVIIFLYLWIMYRGINIIKNIKNAFPALLALGLIFSLTVQAFANMGVAVGLLPVTGQTLPFVSMGGTSNIITGVAFGIILNISREAVIEMKKTQIEEQTEEIPVNTEIIHVE